MIPSEVLRRAKEIFLQAEDFDVYECLGLASKEFVVHPDVHIEAYEHLWAARVGQLDRAIELAEEAEKAFKSLGPVEEAEQAGRQGK